MKANYVIVRADRAGVFFGILDKKEGSEVTLSQCRKLWRWDGACAVEQIAVDGILESKKRNCQFTVTVESMAVLNVLQIIPCTGKAVESIKSVPEWKQ
jgi:hypothetical protein